MKFRINSLYNTEVDGSRKAVYGIQSTLDGQSWTQIIWPSLDFGTAWVALDILRDLGEYRGDVSLLYQKLAERGLYDVQGL